MLGLVVGDRMGRVPDQAEPPGVSDVISDPEQGTEVLPNVTVGTSRADDDGQDMRPIDHHAVPFA